MNYATRNVKPIPAVNLAEEADFSLGELHVSPSTREVAAGDRHETVEPRVMQVLVVLARADGAVVSREQLIDRCWGGRIVGDDAVNNCVGKLRALASLASAPTFDIETIPRVGYRLRRREASALPAPQTTSPLPIGMGHRRRTVLTGIAILAAVASAFGIFRWLTPRQSQEWVIVESHQPFISTPEIERFPAFSPDGTIIAYAHGKDIYSRQIFLQLLSGGDPIQLTHDPFDASGPAWSPDGKMIAYLGYHEKEPCWIMLAATPSGPSHQVGRCRTAERSSLTWDHEGRSLFYSDNARADQPLHIMRFDLGSGAATDVTHPGADSSPGDVAPSVSPDGVTLLFLRQESGDRTRVILRAMHNGAERTLFVNDVGDITAAVWSGDSSTVFVSRNLGSDSSLWAYPASGGDPWRIMSNSRTMERLSSGPNGLLAMELDNGESGLAMAPTVAGEVPKMLDVDGCSFAYARDGTFALVDHLGEAISIKTGSPGHLHEIQRRFNITVCGINWSPDGSRLAYAENDRSGYAISVIGRDGEPLMRIPYPTRDFGFFDWSSDGQSLLQSRRDAHGWRVWKVALAEPHKAFPLLPYGWDGVREKDGALFGVKVGVSGVWRITGTPMRLTDWPSREFPWIWTIAGDRIFYGDFSNPQHPVIRATPIAGGATSIAGYTDWLSVWSCIAVDPKGGQVIYRRWIRDDTDIGWIRLARR